MRGYSLFWVILLVMILAVLAATAAPFLDPSAADRRAVDSTAQVLREIGAGINAMELAVARKFPGRPSQLTNSLTTANRYRIMSCWTNTYSGADSTTASRVLPFVRFYIPTNGLWTPIGRLRDSVENRAGSQNSAYIWLNVVGVPAHLAEMLDVAVDGVSNSAADTVQYPAPVNDTTTIRFRVTPREFGRC